MVIRKEDNKEVYCKDNACGFLIGSKNDCEYVRLYLNPGAAIEKHSLPFPVTFFIVKGNPSAFVNEEVNNVSEGDLIEVDKNTLRGWENKSEMPAEILAIKHVS